MRTGQTITRRSFIVGGTSVATASAGVPLPAGAQETITVGQFRALSARLTGAAVSALDATIAARLLDGFLAIGRGPDLAVLAADPGANGGAVADDIVAAWYSGSYKSRAGAAAFNATDALVWNVLDFTKPPGVCGGATGYWADPYQN
jgi:Membrane bound FAD containing D-sorbitol dehydrogenase